MPPPPQLQGKQFHPLLHQRAGRSAEDPTHTPPPRSGSGRQLQRGGEGRNRQQPPSLSWALSPSWVGDMSAAEEPTGVPLHPKSMQAVTKWVECKPVTQPEGCTLGRYVTVADLEE